MSYSAESTATISTSSPEQLSSSSKLSNADETTNTVITEWDEACAAAVRGDLIGLEQLIKERPELILDRDDQGRSLLVYAVITDRLKVLQYLIRKGVPLNSRDSFGRTPLHYAVQKDAIKCLRYLLSSGNQQLLRQGGGGGQLSARCRDVNGVSLFHLASRLVSSRCLWALIEHELTMNGDENGDADMVMDVDGRSPLHYAAAMNRSESITAILDSPSLGILNEQRDLSAHTALMYAVANRGSDGPLKACESVRELASRKPLSVSFRNEQGLTALHMSVIANNEEVLKLLLDELQCPVETFDNHRRTPLHYAARLGCVRIVELLLGHGARLSTRDHSGVSPAHFAAQHGHTSTLMLLLRHSKNDTLLDDNRRSPFMWAVLAGNEETVNCLLNSSPSSSPSPRDIDSTGMNALHLAALSLSGSLSIVQLLIRNNWRIEDHDNMGVTPLHLACGQGQMEIVQELIRSGADVECRDGSGRTPLCWSCLGGQAHVAQLLLTEIGVSVTTRDNCDRTALHCAAFAGFPACVQTILQNGGDIGAIDNGQLTAMHVACEHGRIECVRILLEYGAAANALSHLMDATPLSLAIANGAPQQLIILLGEYGAMMPQELREVAVRLLQQQWRYTMAHHRGRSGLTNGN